MSTQPFGTTGRRLTLGQCGLLVAAGLGSFLAAFLSQGGSGEIEDDLVVVRPRASSAVVVRSEVDVTGTPSPMSSLDASSEPSNSGTRMNRMVVRDPFGPLSVEQLPPPVVAVAPQASLSNAKPSGRNRTVQPSPPAPPPAAPTAPALPFIAVGFIQGKKIGDGQQQTFIQQGETLTMIRRGDTINSIYRVEDITEERVVLTYLPLGQKQTLPLTDSPR